MEYGPDEIEKIKSLLLKRRFTAQDIANELGRSRNSIISKIRRNKDLNAIGLLSQSSAQKKIKKVWVDRPTASAEASWEEIIIKPDDLKGNGCRWVYGDPKKEGWGYCGHTKVGKAWCPHHYNVVYRRL